MCCSKYARCHGVLICCHSNLASHVRLFFFFLSVCHPMGWNPAPAACLCCVSVCRDEVSVLLRCGGGLFCCTSRETEVLKTGIKQLSRCNVWSTRKPSPSCEVLQLIYLEGRTKHRGVRAKWKGCFKLRATLCNSLRDTSAHLPSQYGRMCHLTYMWTFHVIIYGEY